MYYLASVDVFGLPAAYFTEGNEQIGITVTALDPHRVRLGCRSYDQTCELPAVGYLELALKSIHLCGLLEWRRETEYILGAHEGPIAVRRAPNELTGELVEVRPASTPLETSLRIGDRIEILPAGTPRGVHVSTDEFRSLQDDPCLALAIAYTLRGIQADLSLPTVNLGSGAYTR